MQRKATVRPSDLQAAGDTTSFSRLFAVAAIIDASTSRAPRPLSELFQRPRSPIREIYLHQLFINLVWFARNYLSFIMAFAVVASAFYPWFLLSLWCALATHWSLSRKSRRLWKLGQVVASAWIVRQYGAMPPMLTAVVAMFPICTHALFTPYSDEASKLFEQVTHGAFGLPEPRTPRHGLHKQTGTRNWQPSR